LGKACKIRELRKLGAELRRMANVKEWVEVDSSRVLMRPEEKGSRRIWEDCDRARKKRWQSSYGSQGR